MINTELEMILEILCHAGKSGDNSKKEQFLISIKKTKEAVLIANVPLKCQRWEILH